MSSIMAVHDLEHSHWLALIITLHQKSTIAEDMTIKSIFLVLELLHSSCRILNKWLVDWFNSMLLPISKTVLILVMIIIILSLSNCHLTCRLCGYNPYCGPSGVCIQPEGLKLEDPYWTNISDAGRVANVSFPNYLAKDFVRNLLQTDPEKRPTACECLSHPWIVVCFWFYLNLIWVYDLTYLSNDVLMTRILNITWLMWINPSERIWHVVVDSVHINTSIQISTSFCTPACYCLFRLVVI